MFRGSLMTIILALCAAPVLIAGAATAAGSLPEPLTILFERAHLSNMEQGAETIYHFERIPSDPKILGAGFKDDITLKIDEVQPSGKRNITLQIYSGDRARNLQKITDMTGNPLLVVFLDSAVAGYRTVAGGDSGYLKNQFKIGLRNGAKIEAVKIDYKGKTVDGYRVSVTPYIDDPNAVKMQGYNESKFTLTLSEAIPGEFAQMTSVYESTLKGSPRLEERTTLDGVEGVR